MKIFVALLATLLIAPSVAQTQSQVPTIEQRIGLQIGQLAIENSTLSFQLEQTKQALAAAQSRVRELEKTIKPNENGDTSK